LSSSALDTPMMKQFIKVKSQYPDAVVFYRMGDFYEMFMDDAVQVAPILDITLTTRDKGKADAVPMCGIPVHAADAHIKRLAELGFRVAICEQVEDPKATGGKRLVRREVVEVITPGLVGDPEGLDGRMVVAVSAFYHDSVSGDFGLATLDASTADFRATAFVNPPLEASATAREAFEPARLPDGLIQELSRIGPRELLVPEKRLETDTNLLKDILPDVAIKAVPDSAFHVRPGAGKWLEGISEGADTTSRAAVAVANYLAENQPFAIDNPPRLRRYEVAETVILDPATRRHLELHENSEDRGRSATLIAELDATTCALGARRLSHWLAYPLLSPSAIKVRQDAVEQLVENDGARNALRDAMARVRDLDRILSKAVRPSSVPRDLGAVRASLAALPAVADATQLKFREDHPSVALLDSNSKVAEALIAPTPLPELTRLLEQALIDDPPTIARGSRGAHETGYIREGYRSDLDNLRESATKGREWIAGLEAAERKRSGISTLKIRFHPVHGYSLEVGKAHLAKVPEDYERKQTLASVERYTTEALREVEEKVMGANGKAAQLEREIFDSLRDSVRAASEEIREAANRVADLDALASLAEVARRNRWIRPVVDLSEGLEIEGGRHPVV